VSSAIVVPPGGGEQLSARGSTLLFKAIAATTGGAFSLHERHVPAGARRPPPHVHPDRTEAFWVLSGIAEQLDAETVAAGPGSFVLVPGGVAHTFGAASGGDAQLLVLHSPALDPYFRELEVLWSGDEPPKPDTEQDLMRRHGMRVVTDADQQ
jgi:quercetin dioxygenase-like cupin family protein